MSSGPVGLDSREYGFDCFQYTIADAAAHIVSTKGRWLITKIQLYAGANPGWLSIWPDHGVAQMDVAAGGCLTLEPNGALRSDLQIFGEGMMLIVEYWWQPAPSSTGSPPNVTVT